MYCRLYPWIGCTISSVSDETLQLCKELSKGLSKSFKARACFEGGDNRFNSECPRPDTIDKQNKKYDAKLPITDNFVYLGHLNNKRTVELLLHVSKTVKCLIIIYI